MGVMHIISKLHHIYCRALSFFKLLWFALNNKKFDVIFFCSSYVDELWIRSTAKICRKNGLRICIVIKSKKPVKDICALYKGFNLLFIPDICFLFFIKSKLIITASSGMLKKTFYKNAKLIHMPHSLASLHSIYPANCFSGYDFLFATGPHHKKEFELLTNKPTFEVGYGKFDLNIKSKKDKKSDRKIILLAPSWHADNFLAKLDVDLISAIIEQGMDVILRPHPGHFLNPIPIIEKIANHFMHSPHFSIENSTQTSESFLISDTMISDYSGVAFEFALTELKPAIFVDSTPKILNKDFQKIKLPAFEVEARQNFGYVAKPDIKEILSAILSCQNAKWRKALLSARNQYLYNFGKCDYNALKAIKYLLK